MSSWELKSELTEFKAFVSAYGPRV